MDRAHGSLGDEERAGRSTPPYSIVGRIMNLPEALFLDLDDTILDSYSDPDEAWLQLCHEFAGGLGTVTPEELHAAVLSSRDWLWRDSGRARRARLDLPQARRDIIPYRTPIVALVEEGYPTSVCFCARRSDIAAEAGLETAVGFRGRGLGSRVAAAWALEVRASGRVPLYSTSWSNGASLAVARKLGLLAYASQWRIVEAPQGPARS